MHAKSCAIKKIDNKYFKIKKDKILPDVDCLKPFRQKKDGDLCCLQKSQAHTGGHYSERPLFQLTAQIQ